MSGTQEFTYQIFRNGRKPVRVEVNHRGEQKTFQFGTYVSDHRISELLPRLIMDAKFKPKRRTA